MRPRRPDRGGAGSRLFLAYAVASLVPVLLLGALLVHTSSSSARSWALAQGREQADVIEQMAVAPALGGGRIGRTLDSAESQSLTQATSLAIFSGSVTRLRVRSFAGAVVFSDDGSRSDDLAPTSPAFRAAAAGRTSVQIVTSRSAGGDVVRVVEPVVPNSSGEASGVLEVYLPYAQIRERVSTELHSTYLRLAAGLTALYAVLGLISWQTTRRLRRSAREHEHQSLHDALTGLPNRAWFEAAALAALDRGSRGETGALALVDLDGFKAVNDTHGHHVGDQLLQVVSQRLAGALRPGDAVARLGGDEFGVLLHDVPDAATAVAVLDRVREELRREVVLDGVLLHPRGSFGVALHPAHGRELEDLLVRADRAMYRSKRHEDGRVVVHAGRRSLEQPPGQEAGQGPDQQSAPPVAGGSRDHQHEEVVPT